MDPEIITRTDSAVLGVTVRINPTQADYKEIWEKRFMPRHAEIVARAEGKSYCGVYYHTDEPGLVDFVAGMQVPVGGSVPEGLTCRPIAGGLYAKFRCAMGSIGPTWREIYEQWLPLSAYLEDEERPALEHYPPEATGPDSPVEIFVALKAR
jgi:predicted transcriptional regulator YdeE